MLGPTADWRSRDLAERSSILEPPHQSQPSHHPVGLYSEKGPTQVRLQNHAVTVLVNILREALALDCANRTGSSKKVRVARFGRLSKISIISYTTIWNERTPNLHMSTPSCSTKHSGHGTQIKTAENIENGMHLGIFRSPKWCLRSWIDILTGRSSLL